VQRLFHHSQRIGLGYDIGNSTAYGIPVLCIGSSGEVI